MARKGSCLRTVLYTLGSLGAGGAELRSLHLIVEAKRRHPGVRIVIWDMSGRPGPLDGRFAAAGAEIVKGRLGIGGVVDIWRLCRRLRPDVLHSNVGAISGYFALAAWLARVPSRICHFRVTHDSRAGFGARLRGRVGLALIGLFATKAVGVCDSVRAFASVPDAKWVRVYNGIPVEAAAPPTAPADDGALLIVVLARIHAVKNWTKALAVFEALRGRGVEARLHFVGTGHEAELERFRAAIAVSPCSDSIVAHGYCADPLPLLRRAHAMLLPSLIEGLSGAALEALSVGTPAVLSDIPGAREIAAAVDGVSLMALDAPDEAWAEALLAAARSARRRQIAQSFASGPFQFQAYADAILLLWGVGADDAAAAAQHPPPKCPAPIMVTFS